MSGTYETGRAKKVANFGVLISFCSNYGTAYNPAKGSLSLKTLSGQLQQATDAMQNAIVIKAGFDNATNERRAIFASLKPLTTKVVNSYSISGAVLINKTPNPF